MTRKLKRNTVALFWSALILSILFPCGVLATVFGAIYRKWMLMAFGALFDIVGMTVMPVLWANFGTLKFYARLCAVVELGVPDVKSLADTVGVSKRRASNGISFCIARGYLDGFWLHGDAIRDDREKIALQKN